MCAIRFEYKFNFCAQKRHVSHSKEVLVLVTSIELSNALYYSPQITFRNKLYFSPPKETPTITKTQFYWIRWNERTSLLSFYQILFRDDHILEAMGTCVDAYNFSICWQCHDSLFEKFTCGIIFYNLIFIRFLNWLVPVTGG